MSDLGLLAHAGHWLGALAAVVPVVLVALWIGWTSLRHRRRRGAGR